MSKGEKKKNDTHSVSEFWRDIEKQLKGKNLRLTEPREIILEELIKADHPNANEIYMKVRERHPKISMGTIYRNLKFLKKLGLIYELEHAGGSPGRFEIGPPDHSHFVCEKCGTIFDIDDQIGKLKEQKIEEELGVVITHHRTEFFGFCKECRSL
ncbi:MAG: Fur family transcriptional regulator [Promethearchaeota archaeon]